MYLSAPYNCDHTFIVTELVLFKFFAVYSTSSHFQAKSFSAAALTQEAWSCSLQICIYQLSIKKKTHVIGYFQHSL
jgi:hypothetical protein